MNEWKTIVEEKPKFAERVILDDGYDVSVVAYYIENYDKWVDCKQRDIEEDIVDKMVFWRRADRPSNAWRASNGLYYTLLEMNIGIGSVCPKCGEELEGLTDSNGNNCRICVECSVGMVGGSGFGGWKSRPKEELEKNDEILDKIKDCVSDIYKENPISDEDCKVLKEIRSKLDRC